MNGSEIHRAPPTLRERAFGPQCIHVCARFVGGLLLAAAGLKMWGLLVAEAASFGPFGPGSFLYSPLLQLAAFQAEILLGLWLLSNLHPRAAHWTVLGFFVLLAAASLYLALGGQESCGCFGAVEVNPWWTFALDVAVIGALLLVRPSLASSVASSVGDSLRESHSGYQLAGRVGHSPLGIALGALAILLLAGTALVLVADDPLSLLARLRRESLTVTPAVDAKLFHA